MSFRFFLVLLVAQLALAETSRAEPSGTSRATGERAIPTGPSRAGEARRLGLAGLSAFGRGEYQGALNLFSRAEAMAHSPVFQLYIARSYLELDRIDEGRALLYEVSRQPQSSSEPDAWNRARADATVELEELANTSSVAAAPAAPELEPSRRRETASAPREPSTPDPADLPPKERRAGPNWKTQGAIAAYGSGGAGLLVMLISGTLAVITAGEVKANCPDGTCPAEELPHAEQARRMANIATVGGLTALTGATLGTVLLLWPTPRNDPWKGGDDRQAEAAPPLRLLVRASGMGLELHGQF